MSLLTAMTGVAAKLLAAYGESVTFSRVTGEVFDPETGSYTGGSTVTFSGNAHPSPYENTEIDGTVVKTGDIRLLCETMSTIPEQGDVVTFRSTDYRVMSFEPISVQGGNAAGYVQVRL